MGSKDRSQGRPTPDDREQPSQASTSAAPTGASPEVPNLARRVSGWTTNLLATGVIVLLALLLGRQLVDLYRVTPAPPPNMAVGPSPFDDPLAAIELQFGGSPMVMFREPITSDRADAVERLCDVCARQMPSATFPPTDRDENESRLLAQLSRQKPARNGGKEWHVYQWSTSSLATVVGVRSLRDQSTPNNAAERSVAMSRIVLWGMAVPTSERDWMLYTFRFSNRGLDLEVADSHVVSLPPGVQPLMAVRSVSGDGMTGFRGSDGPDVWVDWYREWLEKHGWSASSPWRERSGDWQAQYRRAIDGGEVRLDLQFSRDRSGAGEGDSDDEDHGMWRAMLTQSTSHFGPHSR